MSRFLLPHSPISLSPLPSPGLLSPLHPSRAMSPCTLWDRNALTSSHRDCLQCDLQAAWRTFRASQRGGRGTSGLDDEIETGGPSEAVEEAKEEVGGDTLFQWGCLDWVSTQTKAADKNNVRSAFIVSVPDLVDFPEEHPLVEACIAQVCAGASHALFQLTSIGELLLHFAEVRYASLLSLTSCRCPSISGFC